MNARATAVFMTLTALASGSLPAADTPEGACSLLISKEIDAATGAKAAAKGMLVSVVFTSPATKLSIDKAKTLLDAAVGRIR